MPETSLNDHLSDIRTYCEHIAEAVDGMAFDDYTSDHIRKSAVEMLFIKIGTSASRIQSTYPEQSGSINGLDRAVSARTYLLHTYGDDLDDQMIWEMTQTLVPGLLQQTGSRV